MAEGDLTIPSSFEGSLDKRVTSLERQVERFFTREVEYNTLSELIPDLGLVNAGEFRAGEGEPGDGFTGVRMGFPGFEYIDDEWHLVGVNNDALMFGLSAASGKAYAAGGALVIDDLGITRTGINFFDRWEGSNAGVERRLEEGMFLNGTTPSGYIWFGDPTPNTNLQINGDFELGNLNDWDVVDTDIAEWTADDSAPYEGTYAGRLRTTAPADTSNLVLGGTLTDLTYWTTTASGTSYWVPGAAAIPVTWVTLAASESGTIATNPTSSRAAVIAGEDYLVTFRAWIQVVSGSPALSVAKLDIDWYEDDGSFISTSTINATITTSPANHFNTFTAPALSAYANFKVTYTRTAVAGTANVFVDDIFMYLDGPNLQVNGGFEAGALSSFATTATGCTWTAESGFSAPHGGTWIAQLASISSGDVATLLTDLGTPDRMAVTAGRYYRASSWTRRNGAATFSTKTMSIRWYDATSGGTLLQTDTVTFDIATADVWGENIIDALAPTGAVGAEIFFNIACNGSSGTLYFDDISFGLAQQGTLTTNLGATPRMAVAAGNSYQFNIQSKADVAGSTVWDTVKVEINWYTATSGGSLVSTTSIPLTLITSYQNVALPFVAPATSAGATIKITAVRDTAQGIASAFFDAISLRLLTTSRYIKFLPNVTFEGGPIDLEEQSSAPSTPSSGKLSIYADSLGNPRGIDDLGMRFYLHKSVPTARIAFASSTAENTIASWVIEQNSFAATSRLDFYVAGTLQNNGGGGAVTGTIRLKVGSFTLLLTSASALTDSATRRSPFLIKGTLYGLGTASTQRLITEYTFAANPQNDAAGGSTVIFHSNPAQDFSAGDITISVTAQLNTSNAGVTSEGSGRLNGPTLF